MLTNFHGKKAKRFFFFWKKKSKWPTQKRSFFNLVNSQYFLVKISWIGLWISRIDWCEGPIWPWGCPTDIRSKTGKKRIFFVFRTFLSLHCKYIGRRYYDILSCLIYHRNLLVIYTVDGGVQPMAAAVFDYSHS